MKNIYYDIVAIHGDTYYFEADEEGLRALYHLFELNKEIPYIHNPSFLAPYVQQIKEYFAKKRTTFSIPIHFKGTPFQEEVWKTLLNISYGETQSYSQIAQAIGHPLAVRAVGSAVGKNPIMIIIPCHRIISKDGGLGGFGGGLPLKIKLLAIEGIHF